MNQAFIDYFRCPENLITFQLSRPIGRDPGYFRFGREAICYGSSTSGFVSKRVLDPLYDTSVDVMAEGRSVRLPFDPDEIIANLRYERYHHSAKVRSRESLRLRHLYYSWIRPLLPASVRRQIQRMALKGWDKIPFPCWPVDGTVEQILELLLAICIEAQGIQHVPFVWFWPDGAKSCAIMTHDVDQLSGRDFCGELMDLDDAAGIKSSFQIVPEERYSVPDEFLDQIRTRGFEVNVHDLNHDGHLFNNSHDEFLWRVARINEYGKQYRSLGFRSGTLYRNQAWYGDLQFSYDMSVPSVAHLDPQKGGCCSVTPFFVGNILELPLTTIQDYSLFHVLNDYSIDLWTRQLDALTERHGLASFNVHPECLVERRARRTYSALLEHLAHTREMRNIWIALPRDVDRWWRERSEMTVVGDTGAWRIEGKGKERARLAFATVSDGSLSFSVEGPK
jgi:hypothetical protein